MKKQTRNLMVCKFEINEKIMARIEYLNQIISIAEWNLKDKPDGNISVCKGRRENTYNYFIRQNASDIHGRFVTQKQEQIKYDLCEKKYYEKLLRYAKKELKQMESISKMHLEDSVIKAYQSLHQGIRNCIRPINVDDEKYKQLWEKVEYEGLPFDIEDKTEYYSDKNERMRSKSELEIANQLKRYGVAYRYECPLNLNVGYKNKSDRVTRTVYPDFTILNARTRKVFYWEHLGKMGDIDYVNRNMKKLGEYRNNGIIPGVNLILTFEQGSITLSTEEVRTIIQSHFL